MFIVFQGSRIPITRRISVGREGNNAIELDDALVSRHHAVIQKVKDAFFIEDLFSTNGTFVNGQAVPPGKYVRLHAGDFVRIGRSVLSLRQLGIKVA
jgi:pSer/pThr/pTyr-binding forkhead associated (FHA) protein